MCSSFDIAYEQYILTPGRFKYLQYRLKNCIKDPSIFISMYCIRILTWNYKYFSWTNAVQNGCYMCVQWTCVINSVVKHENLIQLFQKTVYWISVCLVNVLMQYMCAHPSLGAYIVTSRYQSIVDAKVHTCSWFNKFVDSWKPNCWSKYVCKAD